jgi:hypothetical protein
MTVNAIGIATDRPFTRADALAAGIKLSELTGPGFSRIFHGVYVSSETKLDTQIKSLAALEIAPAGTYVSHHTAAALWGAWVPQTSETHVTVCNELTRSVRRGVAAHRARFGTSTQVRGGVRLSPVCQCFLELASTAIGFIDLVAIGDSLVATGHATPEKLIEIAAQSSGKGVRRARRAAGYVRSGVDSVMESRLRMMIVLAGLPEPVVNKIIRFDSGDWKRRFDLSYPEWKLIIEYDGRQHAENSRQWNSDLRRREELDAAGWRLIVVTADAFFQAPIGILHRIVDGLNDHGVSVRLRKLSAEWHRLFPS